ncbi:MAG: DUF934 domain-containing protein [Pseudomonadota bacterium]
MPLRDDTGPLEDRWTRVSPGDAISPPAILDFADTAERAAEIEGIDPSMLGLHAPNDVELGALADWFDKVALISIDFPSFADGRGFSVARALRARGFQGRLRAAGPVIADQYAYLRACGFDEVETPQKVANRQPEAHWAEVSSEMTLGYQRGYSGPRNILEARRAAPRG